MLKIKNVKTLNLMLCLCKYYEILGMLKSHHTRRCYYFFYLFGLYYTTTTRVFRSYTHVWQDRCFYVRIRRTYCV